MNLAAIACLLMSATFTYNHPGVSPSPYNWWNDGTGWVTTYPGAYIKLRFTGTSLVVNVSPPSGFSGLVAVAGVVDNKLFVAADPSGQTSITLASGLAAGEHTAILYLKTLSSGDVWVTPALYFKVTGWVVDDASTIDYPTLRPNRLLVYGDSITMGSNDIAFGTSDASRNWVPGIGLAMNAEYGSVSRGGMGYVAIGGGGTPPMFTPGNDVLSSYNKHYSGLARSFSPVPDAILLANGVTDHAKTDAEVTASVTGLIEALAEDVPGVPIFVMPGFWQPKREAIRDGVTAAAYRNAFFIELPNEAGDGINTLAGVANWNSSDQLHPYDWRTGQLGMLLAYRMGRAARATFRA